jgi:ABC-type antimicrobial peptide transport system permease subunit
MMTFIRDQFSQALISLGQYKLRTAMSVLGITIGIAAVVVIGAVGQSGKEMVFEELQTFGLTSVWVFRDRGAVDPARAEVRGSGIKNADLELLKPGICCRHIKQVTPLVYGSRNARGEQLIARYRDRYSRGRLQGIGAKYLSINNDVVSQGRAFTEQDMRQKKQVAIIGPQVKNDLFDNARGVVGRTISLGSEKIQVIGILEEKDRSFLSSIGSAGGQNANTRILLPFTTFQRITGTTDVHGLQVEATSYEVSRDAGGEITATLARNHNRQFKYRVNSMSDHVETADRILGGVSIVGVVAAAVSLLVAGLGIFNIMTTAVLERTREIGIRKALGATEGSILSQFLVEASLVSVLGGISGLMLGLVGIWIAQLVSSFELRPAWSIVFAALLVSVLVGILSGFMPALRAARLRPVQALRYE